MDSVTQIVLGASVGQMVLGSKEKNRALLWGAIAGTIPDLDVLIGSKTDIALNMSYHRGFSHSLFFAILLAPILAYFVRLIYKNSLSTYHDWIKFFFWTIVTHPILDSFTSYGTQLLSPISDFQFSFHMISVIDFFYTLPFLLVIIAILFIKDTVLREKLNYTALFISSTYLLFTGLNKFYIENRFKEQLKAENIVFNKIISSPTLMNNFLWNVSAISEDSVYFTNISNFDKRYQEIIRFAKQQELVNNNYNYDINRITWKSEGNYIVEEKHNTHLIISDIRYGYDYLSNEFILKYLIDRETMTIVSGGFQSDFSQSYFESRLKVLLTRIQGLK